MKFPEVGLVFCDGLQYLETFTPDKLRFSSDGTWMKRSGLLAEILKYPEVIDARDKEIFILNNNMVELLLCYHGIGTTAVVMKKLCFESIGGFDPTIRYSEDTDLWLKSL